MAIKRIITQKDSKTLKDVKKFKGKKVSSMTPREKEELLELIAKKLGIL